MCLFNFSFFKNEAPHREHLNLEIFFVTKDDGALKSLFQIPNVWQKSLHYMLSNIFISGGYGNTGCGVFKQGGTKLESGSPMV
jgi:hypothetical protein